MRRQIRHYLYQDIFYIDGILDYVSGGELFTHLYQREKFKESEVRIYIAEIVLALQHLHKVKQHLTTYWFLILDIFRMVSFTVILNWKTFSLMAMDT